MLFTDLYFIFLFLPLFLVGYFFCHHHRWVIPVIFGSSLVFHGLYSLHATLLLVFSIAVNYFFVRQIYQNKKILILSLIFNLGILFFFKYVGWFADVLNDVCGYGIPRYNPDLPLGISFFTFTQIACLADSYREKIVHRTLGNYGAFVSYFPHLIAGPIIHYKPMVVQFLDEKTSRFQEDNFLSGLMLFSLGLAKKIIVADTIAGFIDPVFKGLGPSVDLSVLDAWMAAVGYAFQLYFDFSGYADMAIGISRMANIELPKNFNSPYLSSSLIDFWRRWHISLSLFLKDYLYIPLGGNQKGNFRKYIHLLITMILGGIWHGAGYTYAFWGFYHGVGLVANHLARGFRLTLPKPIGWFFTFLFVLNGWVVFRSPDLGTATQILKAMYFMTGKDVIAPSQIPNQGMAWIIFIAITYFMVYFVREREGFCVQTKSARYACFAHPPLLLFLSGIIFAISLIMTTNDSPFLYFQF
jgi:alginate O-acetyltransferase complex protein AlgI